MIGSGISAKYFAIYFISQRLAITEAEEFEVLPKLSLTSFSCQRFKHDLIIAIL